MWVSALRSLSCVLSLTSPTPSRALGFGCLPNVWPLRFGSRIPWSPALLACLLDGEFGDPLVGDALRRPRAQTVVVLVLRGRSGVCFAGARGWCAMNDGAEGYPLAIAVVGCGVVQESVRLSVCCALLSMGGAQVGDSKWAMLGAASGSIWNSEIGSSTMWPAPAWRGLARRHFRLDLGVVRQDGMGGLLPRTGLH